MANPTPRVFPSKICENPSCRKEFNRRRQPNGKWYPSRNFIKQRYCSYPCSQVVRRAETYVPTKRDKVMIENVRWIIGTEAPVRIAERVEWASVPALVKRLQRCKEYDLANRLEREHAEYLDAAG